MQVVPLKVIAAADSRIPNALSTEKKLSWLNELEWRISWKLKPVYDEYVFTVEEDKPYLLPFSEEQIEWVYHNGQQIPKVDLRSATGLMPGTYRMVYRSLPDALSDIVLTDPNATFGADNITFSRPHPFEVGDLIGISETAENNVTATVIAVNNTAITTDFDGFSAGEQAATVAKINDRELTVPTHHACFGIYEEYLCMQIAKHQNDAARYRLAETAFDSLWETLASTYKQTAPQNPGAKVRGI